MHTAVIFGVGSLVAQALARAPVDRTFSLGLRYAKRLAGRWNGYLPISAAWSDMPSTLANWAHGIGG